MMLYKTSLSLLLLLIFLPASLFAVTVRLPMTLDSQILETLLKNQAFPENGTEYISGTPETCNQIRITAPKITIRNGQLRFAFPISLSGGAEIDGNCLMPLSWSGIAVFYQQPELNSNFALHFHTEKTELLDSNGQPVTMANVLLSLAKPLIQQYVNNIAISFTPVINDLGTFISPLFPQERQDAAQKTLASLRPGEIVLNRNNLILNLLADVDSVYDAESPEAKATLQRPISPEFIDIWESWDSFLVELITELAVPPLSDQDRETLISVLLDTRYAFSSTLDQKSVRGDFVRKQFASAWNKLTPVFRRQLYRKNDNLLGHLAMFTAADALVVLDNLGPTFGIEISRSGLEELTNFLKGAGPVRLYYPNGVDPRLQQLFNLPDNSEPSSQKRPATPEHPSSSVLPDILINIAGLLAPTPVFAAEKLQYDDILPWYFDGSDLDGFMVRVRQLLEEQTVTLIKEKRRATETTAFFSRLLPAVAWQESCFRQFISSEGKIIYLISYNKTSVGMMQINERVWRGLYDQQKLRWDTAYNVRAGSEILDLYLYRYILKDQKAAPIQQEPDFLAASLYAMYNGGPGQLAKFTTRYETKKFYESDRLFAEKYEWVKADQWNQISRCLGTTAASCNSAVFPAIAMSSSSLCSDFIKRSPQ